MKDESTIDAITFHEPVRLKPKEEYYLRSICGMVVYDITWELVTIYSLISHVLSVDICAPFA